MNDQFEEQLARRLTERAAQARPVPDLDAITTDARRLAPQTSASARPRRGVLAAAALALLVAAGTIAVRAADREPATRFSTAPNTELTECSVFFLPGREQALIDGAGMKLRSRADLTDVRFVDQQAAYEEFRRLFATKPELVDSVAPTSLPVSWRFRTAMPASRMQAELQALIVSDEITCTDTPGSAAPTPPPTAVDTPDEPATTVVGRTSSGAIGGR